QVMLAGLAPLLRPHRNPSVRSARAEGIMPADSRESTNRICKQTAPQVIQSSKIEYCKAPLQSCRSMAWQFFTADWCALRASSQPETPHANAGRTSTCFDACLCATSIGLGERVVAACGGCLQ